MNLVACAEEAHAQTQSIIAAHRGLAAYVKSSRQPWQYRQRTGAAAAPGLEIRRFSADVEKGRMKAENNTLSKYWGEYTIRKKYTRQETKREGGSSRLRGCFGES
ncbi:hypothetical protein L7F22_032808 [Adiantum nelumboides]|nr:hypothetical protein [Adiantum nelumboides]